MTSSRKNVSAKTELLEHSAALAKKKRAGKIVFLSVLFLLVVLGAGYLLVSSIFLIKNISVGGNTLVESAEISNYLIGALTGKYFYLFPKSSVFLYARKDLENGLLAKFPRLKNSVIELVDRNTIQVEVSERGTDAVWCGKEMATASSTGETDRCYFADESGFVFAESPLFSGSSFIELRGSLPAEPIGNRPLPENTYRLVSRFARYLTEIFAKTAHDNYRLTATVIREGEYRAMIADSDRPEVGNWVVIFDNEESADEIAGNLFSIFESPAFRKEMLLHKNGLESIDLRNGKKVFYRFKD
ncbi:MAG: hypothetical protein NTY66_02070 [Candidatus Vogelbacteria bacterium]|nr:hypothetical protein [Candidatus Vogelbacteria bacterium]